MNEALKRQEYLKNKINNENLCKRCDLCNDVSCTKNPNFNNYGEEITKELFK
jgi:hypothetical protein